MIPPTSTALTITSVFLLHCQLYHPQPRSNCIIKLSSSIPALSSLPNSTSFSSTAVASPSLHHLHTVPPLNQLVLSSFSLLLSQLHTVPPLTQVVNITFPSPISAAPRSPLCQLHLLPLPHSLPYTCWLPSLTSLQQAVTHKHKNPRLSVVS